MFHSPRKTAFALGSIVGRNHMRTKAIRRIIHAIHPRKLRYAFNRRWRRYGGFHHWFRGKLFSTERLSRLVEERSRCVDSWLFLVGLTNSGTTLLQQILATHPSIYALPREGHRLTTAFPDPGIYHGRECSLRVRSELIRSWGVHAEHFHWTESDAPLSALQAHYDWSRFYPAEPAILLEKSPPNLVRTRWLQRHFHRAQFIAIVRSPYAVCEGIRRRGRNPIEDAALHWRRAHEVLLSDEPHIDRILWLSYEELCADPASALARAQSFLKLADPFDIEASRIFHVHNVDGAPSHVSSFNAKSIARLSDQDIASINRIAGPMIQRLGYEVLQPDSETVEKVS